LDETRKYGLELSRELGSSFSGDDETDPEQAILNAWKVGE
jgi:hypothetical protein